MPAAPRIKGLGQKIAFSILGTPGNIKDKKNAAQKRLDRKLVFQETQRVR